ncbi:MAG: asparagine--tRNA ligase [Phycisphaerales bacterium]|nr:asparagine--tRNA ligase [Phycisphaerales bacterium]
MPPAPSHTQDLRVVDVLNNPAIPTDDVTQKVVLKGWVRTRRDSKAGFSFIHLTDGSCMDLIQVVAPSELENYEEQVKSLTTGCSIIVTGHLVQSTGKGQNVEMQASNIEVIGWVDDPDTYPASAKRHTFEYLRDFAHLRPRTNTFGAVARVRHCVSQAIHNFLSNEGFMWVHTPIITASDCEGAGELFRVSTLDMQNLPRDESGEVDYTQDFFGKESFLTVSGQLNVEAYCLALSRVYTFGPTFRAEKSNTSRHLAEFWMVEPELAFADLNDNANLAEAFLKSIFREVLEKCPEDMAFFQQRIDKDCIDRLERFLDVSFARIEYSEAVARLEKAISGGTKFEYPVTWGTDLQSEHERWLVSELGCPVVVMNYPKEIKAFYMRLNDDGKTVAAMDVLAPGIGEIIGGSQREERLDVLDARIDESGVPREAYWWYRDLRRYGTVPHSGFGLGLERTIAYITGMANVRDVIPYPRTPRSAQF